MPQTAFSARQIYDTAQLGALIRFYDGTPEPPARHRCKRAAWSATNGTGRLVRKTPASDLSIPGFKLHVGDFGGNLTVVQTCRIFLVSSELLFAVLGKPHPGQAAVLHDEGGIPTLMHLARTAPDAENWLKAHPDRRANIVPADASLPRHLHLPAGRRPRLAHRQPCGPRRRRSVTGRLLNVVLLLRRQLCFR
jgi:hypothetical protein